MNEKTSASTIFLRTALVQFLFVSSVWGNPFETHYKTLIGNLAGQSLETVYDGISVGELEHNAESFSAPVDSNKDQINILPPPPPSNRPSYKVFHPNVQYNFVKRCV